MNSITIKVMGIVLSVFVLLLVGSQFIYSLGDSRKTEDALLYTVDENESFKGMFVRDETLIEYNGSGVLQFNCTDSTKLSDNSVIAYVYDNEEQIYYKNQVEKLSSLKTDYEKAQNPGTTDGVVTEALRSKLEQSYMKLLTDCDSGDYSDIYSDRKDLMYLLNVNNILTRNSADYNAEIDVLNQQIESFQSQCADPKDTITSQGSGYFASTLDGYEGLVSTSDIDNLTEERIDALFSAEPSKSENAIGKIIDGYTTKFIGVVDDANRIIKLKLMQSSSVDVRFGSSDKTYSMTVESIRPLSQKGGKYLLVLDCSTLDDVVLQNRFENAELVFDEYSGIKVPREAITFKDGVKGVYTLLGQEVTFKKIDVLYEGNDYALSKRTADEDYLALYDQILVEGVDKKDG